MIISARSSAQPNSALSSIGPNMKKLPAAQLEAAIKRLEEVVKNLPDDFFVRTNARFFWTTIALLVAFGERRLRAGSEQSAAAERT